MARQGGVLPARACSWGQAWNIGCRSAPSPPTAVQLTALTPPPPLAAPGNICVNGGCVCPANQYECYNKCTDVMRDNMNCGYCGNVCPGEQQPS